MELLRRLNQQVRQIWLSMSFANRALFALITVVILITLFGVAFWAGQAEYRPLFSGLTPEDASAVTARLTALSVPYELRSNGTVIAVPADRIPQLRIDLAAEGLPIKGSKGYELFDESPLGMTPFLQHVNYLRALQGELAKTIMRLEPVAQARVHIVQPEPSPFVREQKPTTASVVVWLKPNASVSRSMANGIVALVARSVEGLAPENVTLLDNNGRVLSEQRGPEAGTVPSTQLEYKHDLETSLAAKAEEMLAQALGPGHAIVRVTADINFRRIREKRETYNPEDRVIVTEKITNSKSGGSGPRAQGIVGATPNAVTGTRGTGGTGGGGSTSTDETIDTQYAVSKTIQELEDKVGNVERLAVAAMVDLSKPEADGAGAPGLSLQDVDRIIRRAVGFNDVRDQIEVREVKLGLSAAVVGAEAEVQQSQKWQYYITLARNASLGLAALVSLVLGFLVLRRLRPAAAPPAAPAEIPERTRRLQTVTTAAQLDPDRVARILAAWMEEAPALPRQEAA